MLGEVVGMGGGAYQSHDDGEDGVFLDRGPVEGIQGVGLDWLGEEREAIFADDKCVCDGALVDLGLCSGGWFG